MQIYQSESDQPILDWQWLEPGLRNITSLILKHVPRGGGRALDVGCGTGRVTFGLAERGYKVDAVDIEPRVVELAERIGAARRAPCRFRVADFRDATEVIPEHYDLIVCSEVLEHVVDYKPIHENMYRSLKPGGRLVISVPCNPKQFSVLDTYGGHVRRFTRAQVEEDLRRYRRRKITVTGFPSYRVLVTAYLMRLRLTGGQHSNEALWLKPSTRWIARLIYPFCRLDNVFAFTGLGGHLIAAADK
jgi:SAM-dependent methyltransferase